MNAHPVVSVIIPTRNRLSLTQRALESVRRQTYPKLEVIVVDDGSDDASVDTLSTETGFTLIRLPEPTGAASARNIGAQRATGELLAFLDSDDEWLPDKIARQVELLEDRVDVDVVYCRHLTHDDTTGLRREPRTELYRGDITEELLSGRCPRTVSLFTVRATAFRAVGGFDVTFRGFQDTDLWIRMAMAGSLFDAVDVPLAVVHNHDADRITTNIGSRLAALDAFFGRWEAEMTKRIGADGVDAYKRNALAVAQGAVVLGAVATGERRRAFRELVTYLKMSKLSNPTQLIGLGVACVAGRSAHKRLKTLLRAGR